jgi:hypothetical protein
MKSKKKMLLALGAMSAAAIGAGATSTFAWYQANVTAGAAKTQAKGDIAIDVNRYVVSDLELPVSVTFNQVSADSDAAGKADTTKLLLGHQNATPAWEYGYVTESGTAKNGILGYTKDGYDFSIVYKVTIAAIEGDGSDGVHYTQAEARNLLFGTSPTVKVVGNQIASQDRVHVEFTNSSANHGDTFTTYNYAEKTSSTVTFSDGAAQNPAYQDIVVYVRVSVEGQGFNDGTDALTAGITVTVGDGTVGA